MDISLGKTEPPKEIFAVTIYHYDYATGKTYSRQYFRNPFGSDKKYRVLENEVHTGFWPSLTVQSMSYI